MGTTRERFAGLPDVPTISETLFPRFDASAWYALAGPAKMPAESVKALNTAVRAALTRPDMANRLIAIGAVPRPTTPKETSEFFASEVTRWQAVVRSANLRPED